MSEHVYFEATDKRCKTSELERQIVATLRERGVDLVEQVKRKSWVFDAAVQGTPILVEIQGEYWHNLEHAKIRDEKKRAWAAEHGYTIVAIWEGKYNEDPEGTIEQALAEIAAATPAPGTVDTVDTDGDVRSYAFGDWRDPFCDALAQWGSVRAACKAARVSRAAAYKRRDPENDQEFALAWAEALEIFADRLEETYVRRGLEQSDRAIEFLLKANRREKYGEAIKVDARHSGALELTSEAMTQAAAELQAWRQEQAAALSSYSNVAPTPPTSPTNT